MGTKAYSNALDLLTFTRASGGTALRRIGYGSELVSNGTFDADTTGWTPYGSAVLSVVSQRLKVLGSGTSFPQAVEAVTIQAGKVYAVSVDFDRDGSTSRVYLSLGKTATNVEYGQVSSTAATGTLTSLVVATTSVLYISLVAAGSTDHAYFDNVSVKEVLFDRASDPLVLFNHPNNIPRIEYAADGAVKGLLIEEQRTNLLTYSEDFANAAWTAGALNLTSISANRITPNTTLGQHRYDRTTTISASAHTFSVEAKPDGYSFLWLRLGAINGTFNLDTGEVTLSSGGTASSVAVGGGYFRVSISGTAAGNDTARINVLPTASTADFSGDGTSGVLVRNAQLEAGSFPTSYIPTSGAAATRSADVASIPTSAFGYNQKAGTVVVDSQHADYGGFDHAIFSLGDLTQNEEVYLAVAPDPDDAVFYVRSNNTTEASYFWNAQWAANTYAKIAVAFSEDDVEFAKDGTAVGLDTSATMPVGLTTLKMGERSNGVFKGAIHLKSIQYFPRRLTNAQLVRLTT